MKSNLTAIGLFSATLVLLTHLTIAGCSSGRAESSLDNAVDTEPEPQALTNPVHEALVNEPRDVALQLSDVEFETSLDNLAAIRPGEVIDVEPNGAISVSYRRSLGSKVWRMKRKVLGWTKRDDGLPYGKYERVEIVLLRATRQLMSFPYGSDFTAHEFDSKADRLKHALGGVEILRQRYETFSDEDRVLRTLHEVYSSAIDEMRLYVADRHFGHRRNELNPQPPPPQFDLTSFAHIYLARSIRLFSALHLSTQSDQAHLLNHVAEQLEASAALCPEIDRLRESNAVAEQDFQKVVDEKIAELDRFSSRNSIGLPPQLFERLEPRLARVGILLPTGWSDGQKFHSAPIAIRRISDLSRHSVMYAVTIFNTGINSSADPAGPHEHAQPPFYLFYRNPTKPRSAAAAAKVEFGADITETLGLRYKSMGTPPVSSLVEFTTLFPHRIQDGAIAKRLTPPHAIEARYVRDIPDGPMAGGMEYILDVLLSAGEELLVMQYQQFMQNGDGLTMAKPPEALDDFDYLESDFVQGEL